MRSSHCHYLEGLWNQQVARLMSYTKNVRIYRSNTHHENSGKDDDYKYEDVAYESLNTIPCIILTCPIVFVVWRTSALPRPVASCSLP